MMLCTYVVIGKRQLIRAFVRGAHRENNDQLFTGEGTDHDAITDFSNACV